MSEISQLPHKSPLESLILAKKNSHDLQVQHFLAASSVVRQAIAQQENTTLVLPLRGAMPMYWSADGMAEIERPALRGGQAVEMPLGTYHYVSREGKAKTASPELGRKKGIIYTCLDQAAEPIDSLTMLDEVQHGGTVGPLMDFTLAYANDRDIRRPVRLIATQDSRVKTAAQPKTDKYYQLATNSVVGIQATVVPMPLIACDHDNLLDKVTFNGTPPYGTEVISNYTVERNIEAEILFRGLGTMMRRPEVAHDEDFVRDLVDTQSGLSERAAGRVGDWLGKVVLSRPIDWC
jgi:hypothetical protein